jgi:protein translocase SecG subunit
MFTYLQIIQIILGTLMVITILLQPKAAGFNSNSTSNPIQTQKRGAEKVVYQASILFAILFVLSSLAFVFVA